MKTDRIKRQAESFNIFNSIKSYSEHDIPEYIAKHQEFINQNKSGYGRFIWKPKIIYDRLLEINDNDILLYCDAGIHLNKNGINRFHEYIEMLKTNELLAFYTSNTYKVNFFCKNDAVMSCYPELQDDSQYVYAGVVFIRKTDTVVKLIKEWLSMCETYNFLDTSSSVRYNDLPCFLGQDGDNGLFAVCVYKYVSIVKFIDPNEFNIYDSNGNQIYDIKDWSLLEKYPLQCRRDRPPRNQIHVGINHFLNQFFK